MEEMIESINTSTVKLDGDSKNDEQSQKKFAYSKRKSRYVAKAIALLIRARSCGVEKTDKAGNHKMARIAKLSPQQFEIAMFLLQAFLRKDKPFAKGLVYKKMSTFSLLFAQYSNYLSREQLKNDSVPEDKVMKNTLKRLEKIGLIDFNSAPDRAKGKQDRLVTYINFKRL